MESMHNEQVGNLDRKSVSKVLCLVLYEESTYRQNVFREAKFHKLCVWQEGMDFNLVNNRLDRSTSQQLFQFLRRPIRDTNRSSFACFVYLLHRRPNQFWILRDSHVNNILQNH
jgi:hypothetical protein